MSRGAIAVISVAVFCGALVGARAWVRGQDYLEPGSTSRMPEGARIVPLGAPAPDEPGEVAVVPYRDGARATSR